MRSSTHVVLLTTALLTASAGAAAQAPPPAPAPPAPAPAGPALQPAPTTVLVQVAPAPAAAPPAAAVVAAPVAPAPAVAAAPGAPAEAPAPTEEKASDPFAFADFTWLEGTNRAHKAWLDTPQFTPEILVDVNYTNSLAHPIDNTVVGSTSLSRNDEFTLSMIGVGGDFHVQNVRARIMTQFGMRSTLVPRNDGSPMRGEFDLDSALRYISEAYGGYHWDAMHGVNLDMGIFMSYVGLFSYDTFENWCYVPSYTSDNTPWFFNGIRLQLFPSDKFKVEPWLINGWQTYGKFNELPGFGAQVLWQPVEWFHFNSNDYLGWDTQDTPGRTRFHTDNSFEFLYYHDDSNHIVPKIATSITMDFGGEQGDGVTPFSGITNHNDYYHPATCTDAKPCQQLFLSWMAYNRVWLADSKFAWMLGGGMMTNPGRYLVLGPTGQASPFLQNLSTNGVQYVLPTNPFSLDTGSSFQAFDIMTGFQYMPNELITYDLEVFHRGSSVPYFAGHGGVSGPDGYINCPPGTSICGTAANAGWKADLVKDDNRIIAAMMVRF
jgi:hypothetical protein